MVGKKCFVGLSICDNIFIGLWCASGHKEQGEQPKWRTGMSNANGRVDAQKWALSAEDFVGYGEGPFTWVCERKGPSKQINVPYGLFGSQWIATTKPGDHNLVRLPELTILWNVDFSTCHVVGAIMIFCRPSKVIGRLYQGKLRLKFMWSQAFKSGVKIGSQLNAILLLCYSCGPFHTVNHNKSRVRVSWSLVLCVTSTLQRWALHKF